MSQGNQQQQGKIANITTYSHFTGAVFGCGLGFLLGTRFNDSTRKIAGITMMSIGAVAILPYAIYLAVKLLKPAHTASSMRRKLRSIREGSDFVQNPEDLDAMLR
jgi:hypothetical protein